MTGRSRTLRPRKISASSDVLEIPDKHAVIATAKKRSRYISNNSEVNKSDDQTIERRTRAGSESKMIPTVTRPTRRTRASSTESETVMEDNVLEIHISGLVHNTPVNTRKRRSMLSMETTVIEEQEEKMIPFVALDRVLPNVKEVTETSSGNSTTEKQNKSVSISSSESTCIEGTEADGNAKKEHIATAENASAKTIQENETDMSINKNTLSEISKKSRSDSIDTITQLKTATLDVPKTQSRISTEVTLRKLRLKNERSANNSIKEDLSNKENRASNIIEDPQSEDVTVSNILSQSPQPLIVSDVSTEKSVKENDEDTGSSDNTQNLIVTDTESLSETPLNDSIGRSTSCIEVCEDSSLDENIQILKCPENVNNINSVSLLNDTENQNALSVKIRDDSNHGGGIQIQKCEENINVTHTDKRFGFDNNKKEQIQPITTEDETITKDSNDEMRLILEADETANRDEEESKEVSLTQIAIANAKCEGNNEPGVLNTPENVNDTGVKEYSKSPDMSIHEMSTSLMISMDETTTNDLQETEMTTDETTTNDLPETEMTTDETTTNDLQETEITTDETTTNDFQETEVIIGKTTRNNLQETEITTDETTTNDLQETEIITDKTTTNDLQETEKVMQETTTNDLRETEMTTDETTINDLPETEVAMEETTTNDLQETEMTTDETTKNDLPGTGMAVKVPIHESKTKKPFNVHTQSNNFQLANENENNITNAFENSHSSNVTQSSVEPIDKILENVDVTQSTSKVDTCLASEEKSVIDSNSQDDIETNEIPETVQKPEEKMQVDDNLSDAHIGTDLFQDIPAGECKERNSDKNSVHSMSTERLENEDVSNERKSLYKSIEKSDSEVEEPSEADNDSLNKSPIGSPSNVSDSSKTDESMDLDKEKEYNLQGVEVCKFSDDDVPGDECRASETESSDPDDNGSDLADFVVNDDDEISEGEVDSSEIEAESYNTDDDKHRESDRDAVDEERGKMQMKHGSDEKTMKNGEQKKIDKGMFKEEKGKSKKSAKLGLDKITESNKKIEKSEIGTIDKKRKRNKIKRCIEEQEIDEKELDKESVKVQVHEEIVGKVTKKGQHERGMEENVEGIQNKYTDTRKEEKSKLKKTKKLDLSEISESGKNFKRKFKIETGNKIKKIKAEDNDNTMQKENAIPTWKKYEYPTVKSNKMEVSRKRGRNLLEEVRNNNITMNKSKKRKLLSSEDMPSCSILNSVIEKSDTSVKHNFTSLSAYGSTTNFYVTNIQKFKKKKNNSEVQLIRQRMLLKKRRLANYTMFLEQQKALCTQKFSIKPF